MVKALFDTNILIDYLNGVVEAQQELFQYPDKAISLIQFELLPIEGRVAAEAVKLRQARHIKLPDAIILATARVNQCLLITRNTKDFPPDADAGIRIPYQLGAPPHRPQ